MSDDNELIIIIIINRFVKERCSDWKCASTDYDVHADNCKSKLVSKLV